MRFVVAFLLLAFCACDEQEIIEVRLANKEQLAGQNMEIRLDRCLDDAWIGQTIPESQAGKVLAFEAVTDWFEICPGAIRCAGSVTLYVTYRPDGASDAWSEPRKISVSFDEMRPGDRRDLVLSDDL
ncbi:MAG TPA: hypothetical protein PLV42_11770 [bacterium]|nr:hypothetical protein [bacterium]